MEGDSVTSTSINENRTAITMEPDKMDESCRKALYYFYVKHLHWPDQSEWYGTDGAITKAQRFWKSAFTFRQIENVFECIDVCIKNKIRYDGFSRKETDEQMTHKMQNLVQKLNDIKDMLKSWAMVVLRAWSLE